MNDPHVAAVFYRLEHEDFIDYEKAPALEGENDLLHFRLDKRELTITPKDHYGNDYEAREALENFVRSWEFDVAVESGKGQFSFRHVGTQVVDRNPDPGPPGLVRASARPVSFLFTVSEAQVHLSRGKYPSPPLGAKRNPDNDVAHKILQRLERYHQGRETLATVAYFAVTALEGSAPGSGGEDRTKATQYYKISKNVIREVAKLASQKGGSEARKLEGSRCEYTEDERRFLVAAVQAFTRRAAEVGENPPGCLEKITMETLRARANLC